MRNSRFMQLAAADHARQARMIERAGRLLFGRDWRHAFEDHFQLSNRALRRMLKGEQPVPEGLLRETETAVRDHAGSCDELLEEMGR